MSSWLVNTTGEAGRWKPTDLHQEHNNKKIKSFHSAKGTNASWTTLSRSASANIQVLGEAVSRIGLEYEIPYNSSWHSSVSAEEDIKSIVVSLDESCILSNEPRPIDLPDSQIANDILQKGILKLQGGGIRAFIQRSTLPEAVIDLNEPDEQA
jgi:hypothetical protein